MARDFRWPALLTVPRLLVLSFGVAIALGTLLLHAPVVIAVNHQAMSWVDALFTATSALCVTGLTVRDVGTEFNPLGQVIILVMIQVGGLGILSLSNLLLLLGLGRLGFQQRLIVEATHGTLPTVSVASLVRRVFLYTFAVEGVGALLLTARFALEYPFGRAAWLGAFYAVSAFCNAGFGLFATNLAEYRDDMSVNLVVMALVVLGGIGFVVLADSLTWFRQDRSTGRTGLAFHTRVTLRTTTALIVSGALAIGLLEVHGSAFQGSWLHRSLQSLFLSVTSRTAGFNTVPTGELTNSTLFLLILLMAVGGSPGSAAGGIKTTTLATLYALLLSRARNRPKVELLRRSIAPDVVAKALMTVALFFLASVLATMALQITELAGIPHSSHRGNFLEYLFEVVSALGTVGLSTGVTSSLSSEGKAVIVICMFVGRLGPLIIASSFLGLRQGQEFTYPEEPLIVG